MRALQVTGPDINGADPSAPALAPGLARAALTWPGAIAAKAAIPPWCPGHTRRGPGANRTCTGTEHAADLR